MVKDHNGKEVHDGGGLDRAQRDLKQAKTAISELKEPDEKTLAFVQEQLEIAKSKVSFYTGKVYLLDKVIEQTRKS